MTNYERIVREISVQQLAKQMLHKVVRFDGTNNDPVVGYKTTSSFKVYTDYDVALKVEIEWLNQESD